MIFEKVKSQIVSHLSYKIGSEAEAVVVDPQRDCRVYVDIAQQEGLQIKHIRARVGVAAMFAGAYVMGRFLGS